VKAIDWYCGEGGYTQALRRAGVEVVGACERDGEKRGDYIMTCGSPAWFPLDCMTALRPPAADLWTACESNPRLVAWVEKQVAEHRPAWVWCETVRQNEDTVWDALAHLGYHMSSAYAGKRVHLVAGPREVTLPDLPPHDVALGPRTDAGTLAMVIAAIRGAA